MNWKEDRMKVKEKKIRVLHWVLNEFKFRITNCDRKCELVELQSNYFSSVWLVLQIRLYSWVLLRWVDSAIFSFDFQLDDCVMCTLYACICVCYKYILLSVIRCIFLNQYYFEAGWNVQQEPLEHLDGAHFCSNKVAGQVI